MTTTTTMTKLSLCKAALAALVLAAGLSGLAAKPAHAATTFEVNITGDNADLNLADNLCDTNPVVSGQQCTLRAAIQEVNDTPGADAIHFDIPDTIFNQGVKTIKPNSDLPKIDEQVTIDGYTQPGSSPNTLATGGTNAKLMVQLDGSRAGGANGLDIFAPNSVVRGLVINNFFSGVNVSTTSANTKVEGNFIGTDPSGTIALGNGKGVGIAGTAGNGNTIGGASPATRNLISGNTSIFGGIDINTDGNSVLGNLIGTKKDGTTALSNSGGGVELGSFAANNILGGNDAASANVVAFNGQDGVALLDSVGTGNRILRNSIFSNDEQGIDLNRDGATANDPGDDDAGPNALQNKPALASASTSGGSTTIQGTLSSKPNQTFVVRFFSDPSGDEGRVFRGKKSVTTNDNGNATFSFSTAQAVPVGHRMTATATDSGGNTSEFSAPKSVVAQ